MIGGAYGSIEGHRDEHRQAYKHIDGGIEQNADIKRLIEIYVA